MQLLRALLFCEKPKQLGWVHTKHMGSRTQDQIKNGWDKTYQVSVSVVCATYNHELYLREAIEGFLIQETNFPFEIIIHDDASTDNTANIIKEYVSKYPAIIRPIFQSANQYSKGGFKPSVYAARFAKGEYIALCEGDDYWVDSRKLQLQFDILSANPKIDFCSHESYRRKNEIQGKTVFWRHRKNDFLSKDVLASLGGFAPTASYFFRRQVLHTLPAWFYATAPVGDFFLEMYGSKRGGGFHIPRAMAVYRADSGDSWSGRMRSNPKANITHCEAMLISLSLLEEDFLHLSSLMPARKAGLLTHIALARLKMQDYSLFRQAIEQSFKAKRFLSAKQSIAYIFRKFPSLVLLCLRIAGR